MSVKDFLRKFKLLTVSISLVFSIPLEKKLARIKLRHTHNTTYTQYGSGRGKLLCENGYVQLKIDSKRMMVKVVFMVRVEVLG